MPIPNTTISGGQFTTLQQNITDQANQFVDAANLAQSGLDIIVALDVTAPEVDLLNVFANHFTGLEAYDSVSNFVDVVRALNLHVVNRGTSATAGSTLSSRLNDWLTTNSVTVTATYKHLSSGAGFIIS